MEQYARDPAGLIDKRTVLARPDCRVLPGGVLFWNEMAWVDGPYGERDLPLPKETAGAAYIVTRSEGLAQRLTQGAYRIELTCRNWLYPLSAHTAVSLPAGVTLRSLTRGDTETVFRQYPHASTRTYIGERIDAGMLGAYQGGTLAGFVGAHSEGSIGLLTVRPAFRRRGIARALESAFINVLLGRGVQPFAQVEPGNLPSERLQRSLGLVQGEDYIYWLRRRDLTEKEEGN